jgi:hypothetical protein
MGTSHPPYCETGRNFYNENLVALFPADSAATLLEEVTADTSLEKGLYFLKHFTPFLQLSWFRRPSPFALGLAPNITAYLPSDVVELKDGQSAQSVLLDLHATSSPRGLERVHHP